MVGGEQPMGVRGRLLQARPDRGTRGVVLICRPSSGCPCPSCRCQRPSSLARSSSSTYRIGGSLAPQHSVGSRAVQPDRGPVARDRPAARRSSCSPSTVLTEASARTGHPGRWSSSSLCSQPRPLPPRRAAPAGSRRARARASATVATLAADGRAGGWERRAGQGHRPSRDGRRRRPQGGAGPGRQDHPPARCPPAPPRRHRGGTSPKSGAEPPGWRGPSAGRSPPAPTRAAGSGPAGLPRAMPGTRR